LRGSGDLGQAKTNGMLISRVEQYFEGAERMSKPILVTDCVALIGSCLVSALMQSGNHHVTVVDDLSGGHLTNFLSR
jgi:hypothetical protein